MTMLAAILVDECYCSSQAEAIAIVDAIGEVETPSRSEQLERVWLEGLQDYLGISKDAAESILSKSRMPPKMLGSADDRSDDAGSATSSSPDGSADTDESSDDGDIVEEGECELCERLIKLTRHHLVPRSTWPRIEPRLLHAVDEACPERAALVAGEGLKHLLPPGGDDDTDRSNSKRRLVRRSLQQTCNICAPCHAAIHRRHDNMVLALEFNTVEKLLGDEQIRSFCKWANKQRAGKYALT